MQFRKMRVVGFKSFVEPTEVIIEEGLTGVVGPNGCGKSNVVEALRWTMGENSAKRLRGGEMDDVIFSGSAGRPSRNLAEVTLILDNSQRRAMAEFNHDDEIEVTRRIERGMGSDYRINGRPARQKDVQLLFADMATGAHSTSIVSQGKVASLIAAKPTDRRHVLEEAAGISGLHARKHEAELKLKGAEGNLTRVDDQVGAMDAQLRGLKTQVRQASRYRNLGELIRKAEGGLLYVKAKQAEVQLRLMEDNFAESEGAVQNFTGQVTVASTHLATQTATLPPLRKAEAAASAVVQRLVLEGEAVAKERARLEAEQQRIAERLVQTQADQAREETLAQDAARAIENLQHEKTALQDKQASMAAGGADCDAAVLRAQEQVAALEKEVDAKAENLARYTQQKDTLEKAAHELAARLETLTKRRAVVESEKATLDEAIAKLPSLAMVRSLVDACEIDLAKKQESASRARDVRTESETEANQCRSVATEVAVERTKLQAEAEALQKLLVQDDNLGTPLSDAVKVEPGFEAALAAALADTLGAPLTPNGKYYWQDLGMMDGQALPEGAEALTPYVEAPEALHRALSQIGLVADDAVGARLAPQLKAGQILVTRTGAAWRWDGYTQHAEAITPAAARLQQRNRLAELQALIGYAVQKADAAQLAYDTAQKTSKENAEADSEAQKALAQAFAALGAAQRDYAQESQNQAQSREQMARLLEALESLSGDEKTGQARAVQIESEQAHLPDGEALRIAMHEIRNQLYVGRNQLAEAQGARASFEREKQAATTRMAAIDAEMANWQERRQQVTTRLTELQNRFESLTAESTALATRPAELEAQQQELLSQGQQAEATRAQAADDLLRAESMAADCEKTMRRLEENLSKAKENRVRCEEQMGQARLAHEELQSRAHDNWHCAPDAILAKIEVADASALPALEQLEHDFTRHTRERDGMGPVNLRAEIEAEELQSQIDKMTNEKEELVSAIAKLRQGISTLNREARERLQTAFDQVNTNFGEIFTKLFGGGKAHLQMIDSEDLLDAGLEIFASPPGKRLQALSLLSGGEQALTALSLLFAIFLVNPSPICVLDEVDAPLDESNVDRFCTMLREMADQGHTRFLVITHHRLTMARMDRLYGVTMAEKGVSQLVSVDLKAAIALREIDGGADSAQRQNTSAAA